MPDRRFEFLSAAYSPLPFVKFYQAGDYHRKYYDNNSQAPYCRMVIAPKLEKLEKAKIIQSQPQK